MLNLSTRLQVRPGDNALIGGFIIRGSEQKKVILRGIGPSLNVPGRLDDPVIQLFNSANVNIAGNDDWKTDQQNVEIYERTYGEIRSDFPAPAAEGSDAPTN